MNAPAQQPQANPAADIDALKAKLKATWMDGDYASFAKFLEPGAVEVLQSWNIAPGERMLDVACGAGQIVIPAAHAGVIATGVDIAANQIAAARARAEDEGLSAQFDEGDAENLPYEDGGFDVVTSMFGAMFAPRPEPVAAELARVTRSGGRLFMANWTPSCMVGQIFKVIAGHVPPPPGMTPPPLWGDEETVMERLDPYFKNIKLTHKVYPKWTYPFSEADVVTWFRRLYGPTVRAFGALDEHGRASLSKGIEQVFREYNLANDGTCLLNGVYLDVSAVRR